MTQTSLYNEVYQYQNLKEDFIANGIIKDFEHKPQEAYYEAERNIKVVQAS